MPAIQGHSDDFLFEVQCPEVMASGTAGTIRKD